MTSLLFSVNRGFEPSFSDMRTNKYPHFDMSGIPINILTTQYPQLSRNEIENTLKTMEQIAAKKEYSILPLTNIIFIIIGVITFGLTFFLCLPCFLAMIYIVPWDKQRSFQECKRELDIFCDQENKRYYLRNGFELVVKSDMTLDIYQTILFVVELYSMPNNLPINNTTTTAIITTPAPVFMNGNGLVVGNGNNNNGMMLQPNYQQQQQQLQQQQQGTFVAVDQPSNQHVQSNQKL
ncbi:hypothetical protein ABK040_000951 [Willaertia magna]